MNMLKQIDDLFPKAESRPIGIGNVIDGCIASRSMKINPWIKHPRAAATITKTNSDYQIMVGGIIKKPSLVQAAMLGSYSDAFLWKNDAWARIGNSVPPLFMRSIARQIKSVMFDGEQPRVNGKLKQVDDYPALLDACWQEHLAPRADDAPTVISTFAGAGGSSLGYSMAGYRELLAVEWDDNAVETFRLNFPDVPVYHGDICKLSVEECMRLAGLTGPGELDVLDGSPPCQGFSTAGKRDFGDDRNQLFRQYVRLLRGLRPKVFVMENVSGMVKGIMKIIFADIMRELKASGYIVSARLLNAMYFNVPQSRERMIFIGVRDDLGIVPSHPKAESRPVTVGQAWVGGDIGEVGRLSPAIANIIPHILPYGDGGDVTGKLFFSTKRLDWNYPSRTLNKDMVGSRSAMVHPDHDRTIGCGEAKRITSFPDSYQVLSGYKFVIPILGNSVPPLFMRSIAGHIRREILPHERVA